MATSGRAGIESLQTRAREALDSHFQTQLSRFNHYKERYKIYKERCKTLFKFLQEQEQDQYAQLLGSFFTNDLFETLRKRDNADLSLEDIFFKVMAKFDYLLNLIALNRYKDELYPLISPIIYNGLLSIQNILQTHPNLSDDIQQTFTHLSEIFKITQAAATHISYPHDLVKNKNLLPTTILEMQEKVEHSKMVASLILLENYYSEPHITKKKSPAQGDYPIASASFLSKSNIRTTATGQVIGSKEKETVKILRFDQ